MYTWARRFKPVLFEGYLYSLETGQWHIHRAPCQPVSGSVCQWEALVTEWKLEKGILFSASCLKPPGYLSTPRFRWWWWQSPVNCWPGRQWHDMTAASQGKHQPCGQGGQQREACKLLDAHSADPSGAFRSSSSGRTTRIRFPGFREYHSLYSFSPRG